MLVYPSTLPCPRLKGTINMPESFIKTPFDHTTRYRKSYQCNWNVTLEFIYSEQEMNIFLSWYNSLNNGNDWFEADWCLLGQCILRDYHFDKPPKITMTDVYFTVSCEFIVREK